MILALQGGKEVPFEYRELKLCEKFGWTPTELAYQPWDKIDLFLNIMNIEGQFQEKEQRTAKQKYAHRGKV